MRSDVSTTRESTGAGGWSGYREVVVRTCMRRARKRALGKVRREHEPARSENAKSQEVEKKCVVTWRYLNE